VIEFDVRGLEEMMRQLSPDKAQAAMRKGMESAMRDAANQTKLQTPVDTGLLRADIQSEAREEGGDILGVLGTNKQYAKPVEYGTGLLSDAPDSKKSRYFPPPSALEGWAKRHGLNAYQVAHSIYMKGGTEPKRMFRSVLESRFFNTIVLQRVGMALQRALGAK
jgi:hypothetical protein